LRTSRHFNIHIVYCFVALIVDIPLGNSLEHLVINIFISIILPKTPASLMQGQVLTFFYRVLPTNWC